MFVYFILFYLQNFLNFYFYSFFENYIYIIINFFFNSKKNLLIFYFIFFLFFKFFFSQLNFYIYIYFFLFFNCKLLTTTLSISSNSLINGILFIHPVLVHLSYFFLFVYFLYNCIKQSKHIIKTNFNFFLHRCLIKIIILTIFLGSF